MQIEHEQQSNRFVIDVDDEQATLNYQLIGNVMNIIDTKVPESQHGKGVGGELVRTALDWARESGKSVEASCSFARKWLERHEEYRDILSEV